MSRTRIIKGNFTKIIGGNYKRYSKTEIENIGAQVIQIGKNEGVSYNKVEKFIPKDDIYEALLFPKIILTSNNIISCVEIVSGEIFSDSDIIKFSDEKIDYWMVNERKIYFIPKDNLSIINFKKESKEYSLLNKPEIIHTIKDVTDSLNKQLTLLNKASQERYNLGGKSNQYRKDQILTEGYYRFQKSLRFIEESFTAEQDLEYFSNWLNQNT